MSIFNIPLALATACALVAAAPTQASVVITGTRVIYEQREREVTVRLTNDGKEPALVQAWLDRGDAEADPADIDVPFTLTPPMFRIDPARGQSLRIIYTQEPLPADKESVFWLNVLEAPPKPTDADRNHMQIAFRSRIKLFFRPAGLSGSAPDAPAKLQWSVASDPAGPTVVRVFNPTPYHVSFSGVEVTIGGVTHANREGGMVAPGGRLDLPVVRTQAATGAKGGQPVRFTWINDYGARIDAQAPLGPGA